MGAFDTLSDDDERVINHEKSRMHSKYGTELSEFSEKQLIDELKRRKVAKAEANKEAMLEAKRAPLRARIQQHEEHMKQLQEKLNKIK